MMMVVMSEMNLVNERTLSVVLESVASILSWLFIEHPAPPTMLRSTSSISTRQTQRPLESLLSLRILVIHHQEMRRRSGATRPDIPD
jgi:hypothetical protein